MARAPHRRSCGTGIEHTGASFRGIRVETMRRCSDPGRMRIVLLADGAGSIKDWIPTIANADSLCNLGFYHACDHLSLPGKHPYGKGTAEYGNHSSRWRQKLLFG